MSDAALYDTGPGSSPAPCPESLARELWRSGGYGAHDIYHGGVGYGSLIVHRDGAWCVVERSGAARTFEVSEQGRFAPQLPR